MIMDVGTGGQQWVRAPTFHKYTYKVSLFRLHSCAFLHVGVPLKCMCPTLMEWFLKSVGWLDLLQYSMRKRSRAQGQISREFNRFTTPLYSAISRANKHSMW